MFDTPDRCGSLAAAIDRRFFAPLRRPRTRRVGVELEFPVWNRAPGAATDFDAVHEATSDFLGRFPFSKFEYDDTGALYRAADPATGDELSFDCSFNTLEISFGPDADESTVVPTINAFNALEPFKAVLFANSPFGERGEFLCGRDRLWSLSLHGLNPHNCGMYSVVLRAEGGRPCLT